MSDLTTLLKAFNINHVNDMSVYELAFTHSSFNADSNTHHHDYERLEFLGDSIVGCVVAYLAFKNRKELNQGKLTKLKATLVQSKSLASYARKYNLQEYIKFGKSFGINERNADSLLEDVFEAFMGAIYLDQGYNFAFKTITKIFLKDIKSYTSNDSKDYKSTLQEAMQSEHRKSVIYKDLSQSGPAHERTFEVGVYFEDQLLAVGKGKSKKEAEQEAAKEALRKAGK